MSRQSGEDLLANADAVINVSGSTRVAEEGLKVGRMVYLGTDPVIHEVGLLNGNEDVRTIIEEHDDFATYGENIGTRCQACAPEEAAGSDRPVGGRATLSGGIHNGLQLEAGWRNPVSGRDLVDPLLGILGGLEPGFTELCCHPATAADLDTMYGVERLQELQSLCDVRAREAIEALGIQTVLVRQGGIRCLNGWASQSRVFGSQAWLANGL